MSLEEKLDQLIRSIDNLTAAVSAHTGALVTAPAEEKPKAKPKKEKPEPEPKQEKPPVEEKQPEKSELTLDDVRTALAALGQKKDLDTVRGLLGEFKAAKVSDLDQAQYGDVLDRIEELSNE